MRYEFECAECGESFTIEESYQEHERHRETCPACGSREVKQLISEVHVKTSRKS